MFINRATIRVLAPQMVLPVVVVNEVFAEEGLTCVMTSAWREKGPGSLHPYGYALDFDATRDLTEPKWKDIERKVRERLGEEFDVLAHGPKWHLHVEYDPRKEKPVHV